jgi:hypothetical protein
MGDGWMIIIVSGFAFLIALIGSLAYLARLRRQSSRDSATPHRRYRGGSPDA